MNSRERLLALLLICVIVFGGGGFFGYQFVYVPYSARSRDLERLKKDEDAKRGRLYEIEREKAKLARWKSLSLPADMDVASREYEKYLNELFSKHQITKNRDITPRKPDNKTSPTVGVNKEPIYTRLQFNVHAYASEDNLVAMLQEFYKTGLMHEIRSLSVQRQMTNTPQSSQSDLDVRMMIEALIVSGADKRQYLMPNFDRKLMALDLISGIFKTSPTVLWASVSPGLWSPGLLAEPQRDYAAIAKKNIFLGRAAKEAPKTDYNDGQPKWMASRFVHLTDITSTTTRTEAVVYDVWTNEKVKLREFSDAWKSFSFVKDGTSAGRSVVEGVLVKIEERDVIYRTNFVVNDEPGGLITKLSKADREKLVADKSIKAADADSILRVELGYWEMLQRTKIIKHERDAFVVLVEPDSDKPVERSFNSMDFPVEVLRCTLAHSDDKYAYIRPEERYYSLHMGQSIEDSLRKPLPKEKVKELKDLAAN